MTKFDCSAKNVCMTDANAVEQIFGAPIYVYTRAQAIEDGELVDLTEWASADKGFMGGYRCPVAVSRSVWADLEAIPKGNPGDVRGRAHDLLWMSSLMFRTMRRRNLEQALFQVTLPVKGDRVRKRTYKVMLGGGDAGEPVVTILQPNED